MSYNSTQHDITLRKQEEALLHMTQFSVDKAAFEVYWITEDAHFEYINEQACKALGYTREELLGLSVPDIDPDFSMERWKER